jgi:hypothetical protein
MALFGGSPAALSTKNLLWFGGPKVYNASRIANSTTGGSPAGLLDSDGFRQRFRRQRTPSNPTVEWNRELEIATNGYTTDVAVPVPFKSQQENAVLFSM